MNPLDLRITDPVEALVVEQALALVRQLKQACQEAPHGHVLVRAESAALAGGRALTRRALEAVLNQQACPAEKRGRRPAAVPAAGGGRARDRRRGTP
jgi:hypothetical protein